MGAGVIVVAAGASTRMGSAGDKTLADLGGEPLIARTVDVFEQCDAIAAVALVVSERNLDAIAALREAKGWRKTMPPLPGGARRQDSVRAGLGALPPDCDWVLVHDGARPFVTPGMIVDGLATAESTGAAIAVVPAFDTVKRIAKDGSVVETLDRSKLVMVQTPQVFRRDVLERAHTEVTDEVTDDAAMAERIGVEVRTFDGARSNIKVTAPEDLVIADALLLDEVRGLVDNGTHREGFFDQQELETASKIQANYGGYLSVLDVALEKAANGLAAISPLKEETHGQLSITWFLLNAAVINSLRTSLHMLKRGYYTQAIALVRMAMETNLVARDLESYPEPLGAIREDKIGKDELSLNNMVQRLPSSEMYGWRERHGNLSELGTHLRKESIDLIAQVSGIKIGGYYDDEYVLGTIYDMLPEFKKLLDRTDRLTQKVNPAWRREAVSVILDVDSLQREIEEKLPANVMKEREQPSDGK